MHGVAFCAGRCILHSRIRAVFLNQLVKGHAIRQLLVDFVNRRLHGVDNRLLRRFHLLQRHQLFGHFFARFNLILLLFVGCQQVRVRFHQGIIHVQQDMADAAVAAGHIVLGRDVVRVAIGGVHAVHVLVILILIDMTLVLFLVGFHQRVKLRLNILVGDGHVLDDIVHQLIVTRFFHAARLVGFLSEAFRFQRGENPHHGAGALFVGGIIGNAHVLHAILHGSIPVGLRFRFHGGDFFVRQRQPQLHQLLIHQLILHRHFQRALADGCLQTFVRRVVILPIVGQHGLIEGVETRTGDFH